jgi:hypothetical protein
VLNRSHMHHSDFSPPSHLKNYSYVVDFEWKMEDIRTVLLRHQKYEINTNFDIYIYLTSRHVDSRTTKKTYCFALFRNHDSTEVMAIFHCEVNLAKEWLSPARTPFGSIQLHPDCTSTEVNFFVDCITEFVKKMDGMSLSIQHYSNCYLAKNIDLVKGVIKKMVL